MFVKSHEILIDYAGLAIDPQVFPKDSTPEVSVTKTTLLAGLNTIISNVEVAGYAKVLGVVQCDRNIDVDIYHGNNIRSYNKRDRIIQPIAAITDGIFAEGEGTTIGPLDIHGHLLKVVINNKGTDTQNLCLYLVAVR